MEEKIRNIPEILENELSEIIKKIAKDYNIQPFIKNPDFLEKRLEKWHQFGLLSHTKKVREVFLNELNNCLKNWNLYERIQDNLTKEIKGIKKKVLLESSIPLHDLGKIIVCGDHSKNRKHEVASRNLIYEDFLNNKLKSLNLSPTNIDYIACCVENHYILGKQIRDILKETKKFSLESLSQEKVNQQCKALAEEYSDIKTEIGIFYLCDSLGKTNIRIKANNDNEIIQQEQKIIKTLKKRNLPENLKYAVMQLPVNLKLAEIYLRLL